MEQSGTRGTDPARSCIINIFILVASAFIGGTMFAMIRSVRNAYIGELATPEQRSNAVAVQQLGMTVFQVSGPFLNGCDLCAGCWSQTDLRWTG